MPKQGFLQFNKLINDTINYTALIQTTEIINNIKTSLINLIPNNDTSDLIIGKFWVDVNAGLILKSQLTTKSNGNLQINYAYEPIGKPYGLPHHLVFTVDVKKFKIPKGLATDINRTSSTDTGKPSPKNGKITINFANYQINIVGQYLKTNEKIGYVITDIDKVYDPEAIEALKNIPGTIRFRTLY